MISFDFSYDQPTSIEEAVNRFQALRSQQKTVAYYAGGTEMISRARRDEIHVDAVIDLKHIPECNILSSDQNQIIFGATTSLTDIANTNDFPLLTQVILQIATQTERNKITIGGNLASHLPYREALLPFLLVDARVVIAGRNGTKTLQIIDIFENGIQLEEDEFIVQIIMKQEYSKFPYFNCKRTKQSSVNYPLVSLAALKIDNQIRIACSGLCHFPFRLEQFETEINHSTVQMKEKINQVTNTLPAPILNDQYASAAYREFVFKNALSEILEKTGSK